MATSTDLRAAIEEIQDSLPAAEGAFDGQDLGERYQREALDRFSKRLGAMPWWVISASLHAVIFLLIGLLAVTVSQPPPEEFLQVRPDVRKVPPLDEPRPRDPFKNDVEIKSDWQAPVPALNHDETKPVEAPSVLSDIETPGRKGSPEMIADVPLGTDGKIANIGVGLGGLSGAFGYGRTEGGRKNSLGNGGGSKATESSVEAALRWLARHQEADGSWDPVKYEAQHGTNVRYRVGCTALALLAFLGHGETEKSGKFANVVRLAEQWLLKQQKPNGGIFEEASGGSSVSAGYNHAIAGLALAEAYGMAGDPQIGAAAQKAADYSVKVHQAAYSGWRYDPKESPDLSVTGWFVMQLKSAKMVNLRADGAGLSGASNFLDKTIDKEGRGSYQPGGSPSSSMTAVGLVCRQFMGAPITDPLLLKASEGLLKDLPDWKTAKANGGGGSGDKGFYYWYYGTLGMFQMGRNHGWTKWNETLKPVLIDNQRKGGDEDGSWDPQSWIDQYGGRVFTTAMGAMTLEVYYRYPAMYGR